MLFSSHKGPLDIGGPVLSYQKGVITVNMCFDLYYKVSLNQTSMWLVHIVLYILLFCFLSFFPWFSLSFNALLLAHIVKVNEKVGPFCIFSIGRAGAAE